MLAAIFTDSAFILFINNYELNVSDILTSVLNCECNCKGGSFKWIFSDEAECWWTLLLTKIMIFD
jgi:hypothetical protein